MRTRVAAIKCVRHALLGKDSRITLFLTLRRWGSQGKLKNFLLTIPIDQPMRHVPFSLRDKSEKKLDELVNLDVTERAERSTVTTAEGT